MHYAINAGSCLIPAHRSFEKKEFDLCCLLYGIYFYLLTLTVSGIFHSVLSKFYTGLPEASLSDGDCLPERAPFESYMES